MKKEHEQDNEEWFQLPEFEPIGDIQLLPAENPLPGELEPKRPPTSLTTEALANVDRMLKAYAEGERPCWTRRWSGRTGEQRGRS